MFQLSIERTPSCTGVRTFLFRVKFMIYTILVTSTSGQDNNNNHINQLYRRNNYNNDSSYSTIMDNYSTDYGLIEIQSDDYYYRYKIVDDTSVFPVAISMFCPMYTVFNPIWVVPETDGYPSLLCDSAVPNQTLVQFRSTFQQNFEGPVAVVVTYDSSITNCSVDAITTNVERINAIPNGLNNISHLIIPKSYRSGNYSNQNQYTTDSLNDFDPCMYSNVIPLYADDKLTVQLQSDIKSWHEQQDVNADTLSGKFLMMIGYDVNNDGIINWDDYDSYNYYPADPGSYYGGSSSSGARSNTTVWIIFLAGFCVLFCCLVRYQIRKNEGDAHRRLRQHNSSVPAGSQSGNTRTVASTTSTTVQDVSKTKPVVTEAEFGTLPQITYRANRNRSSKSLLQPSLNVSVDNGEIPTIPITIAAFGIKTDDAQTDKVTGEKGVAFENDIASNLTEGSKGTPKTLHYEEDDNVNDKNCNDNNGFNTSQNLSPYHKIMKENSQQSYGISRSDCCCICLEEFQDQEIITALPRCLHLFHTNCIGEWLLLQKKNTCPLCKTTIILNDDGTSTEV